MTSDPEITCPHCGSAENITCTDDLGPEGKFYCCQTDNGCGTTFRLHPSGNIFDIF